ncbi:iron(III) ABC transporter iron (III)-binding protein [Candidatus Methylomirabilis lanthanidiphila]|uniref:Iron(III) ABC transporter iron (III)-binding protein n=1 Tax=Candidatus Methylomirabilis lanthanidiphila TaxID=2211376 RepID=A0A564ZEI0_9BACT|nr:extracellular solute-binding protein [Candidatus Methylomirabilis lanthanidiphila]VUZ83725.1 iron(III) ABC transporter iron (III)-binding protein [Candidatus Methylomirabilis lanthanidiphila]
MGHFKRPMHRYLSMRWLSCWAILLVTSFLMHPGASASASELVIYSGRKESAIKPVVELFERETGIKVALKVGKTSGLANEIIQERGRPRADIFIATEAGVCEILAREGLLQSYASPGARAIPAEHKSVRGQWTGISGRARVIIYNKNLVKDGDIPNSILDLTEARWKGKIAIAGTRERTTLSWLSALVQVMGEAKAKAYIDKLLENGLQVLPDNSDVWRGVGSGEFAVGLTNSPNYHLALQANLPVGVVYPDQGQRGMGVLVNPNAVAIVKGSNNLNQARRFVDFLLSKPAQELLVKQAFEIPLLPGIDPGAVRPLSGFKVLQIPQERLADLEERTLTLFPGL